MRNARRKENTVDPKGEFPLSPADYFFHLQFQAVRQRDLFLGRALTEAGIDFHRWRILAIIRRIRNCSMTDLALHSAVDRTTLSRAVDRLVADDLVARWSPTRDRRRVNLSLSAKGEAYHDRAAEVVRQASEAMLAGVGASEMEVAVRTCRQVIRNLAADPMQAERLIAYGRGPAAPE